MSKLLFGYVTTFMSEHVG